MPEQAQHWIDATSDECLEDVEVVSRAEVDTSTVVTVGVGGFINSRGM